VTSAAETAGFWCGLCRKHPVLQTMQAGFCFPQEAVSEKFPEGGGGSGPGTIRRGTGAVLSAMKTLNQNRKLLWFTLLLGLVLAGNIIAQGALACFTWTMGAYINETGWIALNFILEFATLFFIVFLLAGLVLGIPSEKAGSLSFFGGLDKAKKYTKKIAVWSLVLALAGMLIFGLYFYSSDWLPQDNLFPHITGTLFGSILTPLTEFPFNPALTPFSVFNPARVGGIAPVSWIYPFGMAQALVFSEINLLLLILTPFVVPLLVLEKDSLTGAVTGSFALIKKNAGETAVCAVFLCSLALGVFLTYVLVQAASGMVAPDEAALARPEQAWIALALVYDGALFCFAMILATVGGIASRDLCISAKSRPAEKSSVPAGEAT